MSRMKKYYIRRGLEIIGVELLLSALASSLYFLDFYNDKLTVFITASAVTLIYLGWSIFCLYNFRLYIRGRRNYFLVNLPFYGVLFTGAIVCGIFNTEPFYTFLFMPFKLLHYAAKVWRFPGSRHLSRPVSAALMSALIAALVLLIPFVVSTKRKMRFYHIKPRKPMPEDAQARAEGQEEVNEDAQTDAQTDVQADVQADAQDPTQS